MKAIDFWDIEESQFESSILQIQQNYRAWFSDINSVFTFLNKSITYYHECQQLDKVVALEELKLEIAIKEVDIRELDFVLNLMRSLGIRRRLQDLKHIIHLGKDYLSRSLTLPLEISLLQFLLGASLSMYGVTDDLRSFYDRLKIALSKISTLSLSKESPEYFDFYKTIAVGMILFYFEDIPQVNRLLRANLANLSTQAVRSIFAEEIESYKKKNLLTVALIVLQSV